MRMGKPDKIRRGQQAQPKADARLYQGTKPKHAARNSVVGQLSPDIISVYFGPELKARAIESLEQYSEAVMLYEDQLKEYNTAIEKQQQQANNETDSEKSEVEIDVDGTVRMAGLPTLPKPPKAPLFQSEYWINELDEVLSDTSEHFQSKNGGWKVHARAARFERLMDERYGRFRPLIKQYPELEQFVRSVQRKYATGYFSPFRQGKPPIPKSTAVIILFMMQRGNLRWEVTGLAVLFFLVGLQPWALVVLVAGGQALLENRKRKPLKPMKSHIPATPPYYAVEVDDDDDDDGVDEEKERQHKIDMLKQPVGTKLEKDEYIDSSQYDTILLGSGPATLYTGALLSRAGRKVLVLSSKDDASGCYTLEGPNVPEAFRDVPFDVESSNVSKCSRQQSLLAPALCSSTDYQGGIRFAKIGSQSDGYAFEILSVPGMGSEGGKDGVPFVVRGGGTDSLVEDAALYLGDGWPGVTPGDYGSSASAVYISVCEAMNATSNQFYLSKMLNDSVNSMRNASTYQEATIRYASVFLERGFPLNAHTRSLFAALGMKGENLKPSQTSMGAHVTNVCSALSGEGMHYPVGGPRALCHAFRSVIEENGGRIRTQVPYGRLLFEETAEASSQPAKTSQDGTNNNVDLPAPRCIGVQLGDKREIKFDMSRWQSKGYKPAVVSMLGLVTTFIRLLPDDIRTKYKIPRGLPALSERRPVIMILFALKGSERDLEVTGADYYRLPAATLARDGVDPVTGEIKLGEVGGPDESTEDEVQVDSINKDPSDNPQGAETAISASTPKKSRKVKYEVGSSWMRISFPSAKDPSFESRHGKITTCVVTIEADDDFVTPFETKPKLYSVQRGKGETHTDYKWLMERVEKDLLEIYPQLSGKFLCSKMVGPLYRGLSHNPERFAAKGVRPQSPYPGLFSGGSDLTVGESFSGSIVGGWLAANAVMGYSAVDHLFLKKNITTDIARYMEIPDSPDEQDLAVDFDPATIKPDHETTKETDDPPELKKEE